MKKALIFTLLCLTAFAFGQIRSVSKKVQELNAKNQNFENYALFTKNSDVQKSSKFLTSATDVTVLNIDNSELERINDEAPEYLSLTVPYQSHTVQVELYKQNIFTENFVAKDEQGNVIDYQPGQYYRGVVNGDYTSLAGISFFEDNVMGVISTYEFGNIILGKSTDKQDYITYSDKNLLGENPFQCGIDELDYNVDKQQEISFDPEMMNKTMTENCVKIYYEIAYRPYQFNGYDFDETMDWITGMHNNIAILYDNDNINVALHAVKIWTTEDPYVTSQMSPGEILSAFANNMGGQFQGDIGQLVDSPSSTSIAYLDSVCTSNNVSYAGTNASYQNVPTYSWNIMAMTHEMGHSLGSPHTHACAWNGNNTAIDGCGPAAGAGEGCNAPFPDDGGTIMSYCHLIPSVGINFLNGFGPQPGALIRSKVDSKPCLGTDCSCMFTVQDVEVAYLDNGNIQAQIIDNTSTEWQYRAYPFGETPSGDWQTTTSNEFTVNGLAEHTYYMLEVMNICGSGSEGGVWDVVLLPGDFCNGELFTDTGGETGSYDSNQHIVKTFYPVDGDKVELAFERIGLQNGDVMNVYNGDSVGSPLFDEGSITGNNVPGPTFVSTDATGAITIEFISNSSGNAYGWEATVDCAALGVEDLSDSYGITVYPNPASEILNVIAQKGQIQSVKLTDVAGRTVINNNVNKNNTSINVNHLPKGVYILTINVDNKIVTKKIIKK